MVRLHTPRARPTQREGERVHFAAGESMEGKSYLLHTNQFPQK